MNKGEKKRKRDFDEKKDIKPKVLCFNELKKKEFDSALQTFMEEATQIILKERESKDISELSDEESLEEENEPTRIKVAENVSMEDWEDLVEQGKVRGNFFFENGSIFVNEVGMGPKHSAISGVISSALLNAVAPYDEDCDPVGEVDYKMGPNRTKKPDAGLCPDGTPIDPLKPANSAPWPTVVVEVGVSQSLMELHQDARDWLAIGKIQIVILIKVWPKMQNGSSRMVALKYRLAHSSTIPEQVISFGTAALTQTTKNSLQRISAPQFVGLGNPGDLVCGGRNMPLYQLTLPSADVFHGVNPMPPHLPPNFSIDLFKIQKFALKHKH